jgi:hypothetical protein
MVPPVTAEPPVVGVPPVADTSPIALVPPMLLLPPVDFSPAVEDEPPKAWTPPVAEALALELSMPDLAPQAADKTIEPTKGRLRWRTVLSSLARTGQSHVASVAGNVKKALPYMTASSIGAR